MRKARQVWSAAAIDQVSNGADNQQRDNDYNRYIKRDHLRFCIPNSAF